MVRDLPWGGGFVLWVSRQPIHYQDGKGGLLLPAFLLFFSQFNLLTLLFRLSASVPVRRREEPAAWGLVMGVLVVLWAAPALAHDKGKVLSVTAQPIALHPFDKQRDKVGRLRFLAGYVLRSTNPRFGGYSGLLIDADGGRLLAVSDAASFLTLDLVHDAEGRMTGIGAGRLYSMANTKGQTITNKRRGDAESLARHDGGGVVIGLEDRNEVWRFRAPGTRPVAIGAPPGLKASGRNSGLEALARLRDGRLIALTETLDGQGRARGWIGDGKGAWQTFNYVARDGYHPTGAAPLPEGDMLLLERRFSLWSGFSARVVHIAARDLQAGALVQGSILAEIGTPLSVDNMEGIDVRRGADGKILVYLIADNNFQPLQRTLLLQFVLE